MNYINKKEKLEYLIELMNKGNCGNAAQLAGRLGVSERTLKNYLSTLREMGYKVIYDQSAKTYLLLNHENS
ncbi:hypothetical protein DSECCO2_508040 [anaerobic digester metagenome]|jgi:predicted DNA-binding transcriptional regulator YafY